MILAKKETVPMRIPMLAAALSVLALGCGRKTPPASAEGTAPVLPKASAPVVASHAETVPAGEKSSGSLSGKVLETMDAGGYTYMRLKTPSGETWAAVNQSKVKKGDDVTISAPMTMNGFESKTLGRKFDQIVFGTLVSGAAEAAGGPSQAVAEPHAAAVAGPADVGEIKVPKAEGADAKTVAEVFARKSSLKDAKVAIRGKVVKFTPGVMGKNWIHLRDGSGSHEKKDDDITVTTQGAATVGDVVVVRGTVRLDKDFGMGYAYPVLVEDATVTK